MHRVRKLGRRRAALLGDALHHRLGEQRVAPRALGERLGQLRGGARPAQQTLDQLAHLGRRQRFQEGGRRHAAQGAPARAPLEQLVAGERDLQHGRAEPLGEVLDQVERALVGPVNVLPREQQGALLGERLEHRAHGPEEALAGALPVLLLEQRLIRCRLRAEQARERCQAALDLRLALLPGEQRAEALGQLRANLRRRIPVEDAALGAQHLGQRPVHDARAECQAAPAQKSYRSLPLREPLLQLE